MSDAPPVDPQHYRRAIGRFATGVTVLTTSAQGHEQAMTANSVTSVSLEPVLLLACVHVESRFHEAVLDAGVWGVSVLAASARTTASWFATHGRPLHGQLDRVAHRAGPRTGVPLLEDALATFECRTHAVYPGGDHSIVVGEVLGVRTDDDRGAALTYYRGAYGTLD